MKTKKVVLLMSCFLLQFASLSLVFAQEKLYRAPLNPKFAMHIKRLKNPALRAASSGNMFGYVPSPIDRSHLKGMQIFQKQTEDLEVQADIQAPVSYDLRTTGKLSPVKNQYQGGNCGSCWAIAATASLESNLLLGEAWDFSEENLKNRHGFDYLPCAGGDHDMALAYFARWSGPYLEGDDPYNASANVKLPMIVPSSSAVKHLQQAIVIPGRVSSSDNENIKQAIMTYGAVSTSYLTVDSFYDYLHNSYYCPSCTDTNHAVTIVGWDDNYPSTNFLAYPPGNGAFIVQNTVGTSWGENGYFYVSYYDNSFARDSSMVFNGAELSTNYSNIYQYDPLGQTRNYGYGDATGWFANIFTATTSEELNAVSFHTPTINSSYEIYVYTDVTSGPVTGTLAGTTTGTVSLPGYHTMLFDSPILLSANQKFSVVVKLTTPGYNYPIPTEHPIAGHSSGATANAGESFVSHDGTAWSDTIETWLDTGDTIEELLNTNVCLKAFTVNPHDTWTQKVNFGGTARYSAVGFSIGSRGYIGTGYDGSAFKKDFWEYNPLTNAWTQKADFGGTARYSAVGFSIGSRGYIGTGRDNSSPVVTKDFWEYNPTANTWTKKADFLGAARYMAVGFSIEGKGYIGTGYDGSFYNDFWEYDPTLNTWTQKADFGGTARYSAVGFSIGSRGYIGTGVDYSFTKNDFWEYDPAVNTWTQKADFGGRVRSHAVGFSIGSRGYIGTGYDGSFYNDFWEYDPTLNTWTQKADFGGRVRSHAVGFSIGSRGYIGTGYDGSFYNDLWEYNGSASGPSSGTLQFSSATYGVNESGTSVLITATRTGGSGGSVGVSYATSNGTAIAGSDYTAASGTLSWAHGDTANKTFTVPITNDTLNESSETFTVTLSSPTGGATLGSPSTGTVTITDDDTSPTVQFSAAASNGSEATTPASLTATLSSASGQTVTVNYTTANGTATAGSDYSATNGTLTFVPGTTSQTITVPIINDTAVESNETFTVTLSSPVNATLGSTATHTYTINDDDIAPDTTPDPFAFTPQTNVALNTVITSNSITVSGINMAAPISITGGTYSINGGSYTGASGTVSNGNTVAVRLTSSGSYSTTTNTTLTIGGASGTFSVTTQNAIWQPTGLEGNVVLFVAIDPTNSQVVYAGTRDGGFFKTTDGGTTWATINTGLTGYTVSSYAIDPTNSQVVYAGTRDGGGIFKTVNEGVSWTQMNTGLSIYNVQCLAIDPTNNQVVYAGLGRYGESVFKTTNGGSSWTPINTGLDGVLAYSLAIDPTNSQIAYVGTTSSHVYKTTNGGASWMIFDNGIPDSMGIVRSVVIDPANSQIVYAADWEGGGVLKTTNGGASWTATNTGLAAVYMSLLSVYMANSQVIYAAENGQWADFFKTTNGGSSWTRFNSGLPNNSGVLSVAIDPTNSQIVYAGTGSGVFKTAPSECTTPDPFAFTPQTNVALNTVITSNSITVSGINMAAPISITGGTYSINGGPYTSASGTVNNGSRVTVLLTSSGSYSTTTSATLTIGGVSDTFSVTTLAAPSDTTPDPFAFTPQTNVALNTVITSNSITVSGINMAAPISITGGTYSINGGSYTGASGTVSNGNTVAVRLTSSGSYSTTTSATLTIGGVSGTFSVTTLAAPSDTTPDPFAFTPQTNVALNTVITSNSITVSGINMAAPISITGGTYSINGGSYTGASGTVSNGNTVAVRLTSSGSYSTTTSATLTIGGVSGTFSVTTLAAPSDTTPDPFAFTPQTNVALNTVITSNSITVSGINMAAPISITGGTYSINGGSYTGASGTVSNGNTVAVRLTSSGSYSTTTSATLTIGGVSGTFSVTTLAGSCDTPAQFSFIDETGARLNQAMASNTVTVGGVTCASSVSISGGTYSIDEGPYTSASGTVNNGSRVTVLLTSSGSYSTTTSATLTIGGVSDTFSVTTRAVPSGPDLWTQKANFAGTTRNQAVGFSIGDKGYIGTGYDGSQHLKDFWEYDPSSDTWTQKADFEGTPRRLATGFSIGSKGYIGTGLNSSGQVQFLIDFWEYDPISNVWTRKADVAGGARYGAFGFSIGNRGYVGMGIVNYAALTDFWEYDPDLDTWIQKANFGGTWHVFTVGFSIGSKGYVGTGQGTEGNRLFTKDFWEYDPTLNTWTQKADFGGTTRENAVGFSIGNKGYIGTGQEHATWASAKDFWEYDPALNTWTQRPDFGGTARSGAVGFSIGSKGYIGTAGGGTNDFWEYDPAGDTSPDPFAFTPQTNVALNTVITSNSITVSGINVAAPISITGGTYSINGGSYTGASGTVSNGNTVAVRLTSSGSYSTTTSATLTIGGVSGTFSVTTLAAPVLPGTLQFSSATYNVNESGGSALITVTRTGGSGGAVGVSYATSNGTAIAGSDYTATSGTLSWANGDAANKTFTIPITNDTLDESNETFTITLSNPTGGATLGSPSTGTVTIVDNDATPTVQFSTTASSGGEATTPASITVTLSASSGQTVTVNYATSNGTAAAGSDYTATSGTLTFAPGVMSRIITVPIMNDTAVEGSETFMVALSSPVNATLGTTTTHTYTISDNDSPYLTATRTGTGSGTLTASGLACSANTCFGTYSYGAQITITATPNSGSAFTGFTGCDSTSGNTCTVTMISNKTVTATFTLSIYWRNTLTGQNVVWYMNGATRKGYAYLPTLADQNWKMTGITDHNKDGYPDLYWRNTSTGENVVWYMNGATRKGYAYLPTLTDQNWKMIAGVDFDNDGKPDILWRNTSTGENVVWYMNGATRKGYAYLPTLADQNWKMIASVDFDNDGKPDILWRNTSTGENVVWYMNGAVRKGYAYLPTLADQNWKMIAGVDFDNDGKPDILWRNTSTGENVVWYMNGATRKGYAYLPALTDQNWKMVGGQSNY